MVEEPAACDGVHGPGRDGFRSLRRVDPPSPRATMDAGQRLWNALHRARRGHLPAARAQAEDALFRHYLPVARELTEHHSAAGGDRDRAGQAAEIGLARAILDWPHESSARFEPFARLAIARQIRGFDRAAWLRSTVVTGRQPAGRW